MVASSEVELETTVPPGQQDGERAIFWDSAQGVYFAYTKRLGCVLFAWMEFFL
jgi:hypothetical protein